MMKLLTVSRVKMKKYILFFIRFYIVFHFYKSNYVLVFFRCQPIRGQIFLYSLQCTNAWRGVKIYRTKNVIFSEIRRERKKWNTKSFSLHIFADQHRTLGISRSFRQIKFLRISFIFDGCFHLAFLYFVFSSSNRTSVNIECLLFHKLAESNLFVPLFLIAAI